MFRSLNKGDNMFDAVLGPTGANQSRRQDRLPQDVRDILAWAFAVGLSASDILPLPMSAAEVQLDRPMHHVLNGGDGFLRHGGSDSLYYMKHADEGDWALVFANDCDGNAERGAAIMRSKVGHNERC
jgi:hypothetical protein